MAEAIEGKMRPVSKDIRQFPPRLKARLIASALPFMQRYEGQTVVIKYGGNAMGDRELLRSFARDVALLKQAGVKPVVVHGGGPQIGSMLDRLGIESQFRNGLRVTDWQTIEVVEMVLAGSINKSLVAAINEEGPLAVGLSGKDGGMVFADPLRPTVVDPDTNVSEIVNLGFVGDPINVDRRLLDLLTESGAIPVIAPVALGKHGHTYNINADTFAGAIAGALQAQRLLFLTDVPGVLDPEGRVIEQLTVAQARSMIADGTVSGGMIPKVETCIDAVSRGVEGVVVLDGISAHAVLLELFTDGGLGTLIRQMADGNPFDGQATDEELKPSPTSSIGV